jgi:hypothetical protein
MKLNVQKTAMMVVSDARSFEPYCYIETEGGQTVGSDSKKLKILGFTLDTTPGVGAHIDETIKKARRRYWVLRHLRKYGFSDEELVQVYQSVIRSVLEYCCVVYHSMLTAELVAALERVQYQALRCIYGFTEVSYRVLLERSGLSRLEDRRLSAIDKFTARCLGGQFSGWFPKRTGMRATRNPRPYVEKYARCDRLRNSPLYFMRRRLNDACEQKEQRA